LKNLKRLFILFVLLLCLLQFGCSPATSITRSAASGGTIDLSRLDFDQGGITTLDGDWQFYWNQLLSYDDLSTQIPDTLASVPDTWDNYFLSDTPLPAFGYATYRLHVITSLPSGTELGLWINNFSSAYNLFIDGDLVSSNGRVAMNANEEIGQYDSRAVYFEIPGDEFDIVIQVSNFHYARGGVWYNLILGSADSVRDYDTHKSFVAAAQFGILMIVFLYCISVYLLLRELKINLIFGFLCFFLALFLDALNMTYLWKLFPTLSIDAYVFIWYSSGIWATFLLVAYFAEIFRSRFSSVAAKVFLVLTAGFQLLHIVAPVSIYTACFGPLNVVPQMYLYIPEFACILIMLCIRLRDMKRVALLNIFGIALLVAAFIHDSLYYTHIASYNTGELSQYGAIAVLLIQLIYQAKRTREYRDNTVNAELKFLRAQINPHFLYNSMNTFISISRYDPDTARNLMANFSEYLRKRFDIKGTGQLAPLKEEIKLAQAYLNIEQARFEDRIDVRFDLPELQDVMVPACMLQPVVENAVIHGILPKPQGGRIDVKVERSADTLHFSVRDDGVGMDAQMIRQVVKSDTDGVGLANISQRLYALYRKKLTIVSTIGDGTTVSWDVPLNGKRKTARRLK